MLYGFIVLGLVMIFYVFSIKQRIRKLLIKESILYESSDLEVYIDELFKKSYLNVNLKIFENYILFDSNSIFTNYFLLISKNISTPKPFIFLDSVKRNNKNELVLFGNKKRVLHNSRVSIILKSDNVFIIEKIYALISSHFLKT